MRYVRSRPDLMLVLAIVFFAGTFGLNFQMTSALMATEVFGKGASEYGLLGYNDGGRLADRRAARRATRRGPATGCVVCSPGVRRWPRSSPASRRRT